MNNIFELKSFRGGISDYENVGIAGSFKYGESLDIRRSVDALYCQQDITDDLASGTMGGTAFSIVNSSDGNTYFFCGDGGIYKRTSAGVYTLVYTDTDAITGAQEWYNNVGDTFLTWATDTSLHRKELPGLADWSDVDATVNGQTYPKTLTSSVWHTLAQINGSLLIANVNTVAMVGWDDSFTDNALQLIPGNEAMCFMEYKNYAYIGCTRSDRGNDARLFVWDTAQSLNWNDKGALPASANALVNAEFPIVQCGDAGQLFLADAGAYAMPLIGFPGGGYVNPGAVEIDRGMAIFGVSGGDHSGIYSFGRVRKNDNLVLNYDHPFDCDKIGAIKFVGGTLLFSYKDGESYGIKKVSSTKATGIYQSIDLIAPILVREPVWTTVRLIMGALPAGCSVEVWRKIDKTGAFTQANLEDGSTSFSITGGTEAVFYMGDKGKICEVKIILNPYGDKSPEVYRVQVGFE